MDPFKDKVTDRSSLRIEELSGGNTNFNYVVHHVNSDNKRRGSVFIKHAKAYAKGRLTTHNHSLTRSLSLLNHPFTYMIICGE